jgi:hypothetical protein
MNARLKAAIEAYNSLDRSLPPVPFAQERENALVEFLHGIAAEFGREIDVTRIDSRGDMAFNVVEPGHSGPHRRTGRYGDDLAALISLVPRRTGIHYIESPTDGMNGWCHINHFAVERLLRIVDEHGIDAAKTSEAHVDEEPVTGPRP